MSNNHFADANKMVQTQKHHGKDQRKNQIVFRETPDGKNRIVLYCRWFYYRRHDYRRNFRSVMKRVAYLLTMLCCVIITGCATQQSVTSTTYTLDSVRVEYRMVHDTIIHRDTLYLSATINKDAETESETTIQFGDGGGTYNALTGDATNVVGVGMKESKREHELSESVQRLTSENTQLHHELDSLGNSYSEFYNDTDAEPVQMTKFQRFMYTSGWIMWGVIIVLLIFFVIKILRKIKVIPV